MLRGTAVVLAAEVDSRDSKVLYVCRGTRVRHKSGNENERFSVSAHTTRGGIKLGGWLVPPHVTITALSPSPQNHGLCLQHVLYTQQRLDLYSLLY